MTDCPSHELLEAFLLGAVSNDQLEVVGAHVQGCFGCSMKLDGLSQRTSPLVARLRQGRAGPPDAVVDEVVQLVKQAVRQEARAAPVPRQLDEYRLQERLGEGGMGQVFRAVHTRLGKKVAVKVLAASRLHDPQAVSRFEREMKAVGALCHPNIVGAHDAAESGGRHYLVMELVPGADLARLVKDRGPLPVAAACEIARQAAEGLAYAHGQGLVHRDIKPSNLILTPEGAVKILDLGLALLKGEAPAEAPGGPDPEAPSARTGTSTLTAEDGVMGTNDYMAPEQWEDSHSVGPPADQYSLGCTLFFLLAGRPPFDGPDRNNVFAKCLAHRMEVPLPLRKVRPDVPARLEKVVLRLLAKSPADRFPDAGAVAEALRQFAAGSDLAGLSHGVQEGRRPAPPRQGQRYRFALLCVVGLGLAGLLVAWSLPRTPRPPERPAPPEGSIPMSVQEAAALQKQWAGHLEEAASVTNSVGMDMVLIPPGVFGMTPELQARISQPYRLAATEATVGQFRAFVEATGYRTEAETSGKGGYLREGAAVHRFPKRSPRQVWRTPGHQEVSDDHPVTQVTWVDAGVFCRWLGEREGKTYRLPTEAEWKWACRAGSTGSYVLGNGSEDLVRHAWVATNAGGQPRRVRGREPNAWGLFDMLGNVREWVLDWDADLPLGKLTDPAGPAEGTMKVLAGSDYFSVNVSWAVRGDAGPGAPIGDTGLRVLCEVVPPAGPRPLDDLRPPPPPKKAGKAPPP
jgi:serine/threonine protein kinase/formylglycine-generating enzyme required for sulfatase activity